MIKYITFNILLIVCLLVSFDGLNAQIAIWSKPTVIGFNPEKFNGLHFGIINKCDFGNGGQFGLINQSKKINGIQIGLYNEANKMNGLCLAFLNNCGGNGISIGFLNAQKAEMNGGSILDIRSSYELKGAQLGVVNINYNMNKGFQLGLINYTNSGKNFQIGLINIRRQNPWFVRILPVFNCDFGSLRKKNEKH